MVAGNLGVTIAIPNWNHELVLPRAIQSALRSLQILRDQGVPGEVLVIDEGSRDGSLTLLRQLEAQYYDQGLRVLAFADTERLAVTRNQALAHGRYRYVAFCDADNELVPENLPVFLRALQETGAAAAYGNLLYRSVTSKYAFNVLSNESFQGRIFSGEYYMDAFSVVDRRQILDIGGYNTTLDGLEDQEMWLHLATNGRKIVFVPIVLGYYYILASNAMSRDTQLAVNCKRKLDRVFDQLNVRATALYNTTHLRYFPSLGYI